MDPVTILRACTGLNNKVDPVRLRFDPESGVQELAVAKNVDIDQTGRISRVKGYTQKRSDNAHSLWSSGTLCYYVSGDSLYRLNADWTRKGIRSYLTVGAPMSFAYLNGKTYYANGHENGYVVGDTSYAWSGSAPTTDDPVANVWDITTTPPVGHLLDILSGYMLIAEGSRIWWSMQFAPSWYRLSRDVVHFESDITMMKAIEDGVWISTETDIYWIGGRDPGSWTLSHIETYPAVSGTGVTVHGSKIGNGDIPGMCAIWATPNGVCLGGPQGYFRNLTDKKLIYPSSNYGAGGIIDGNSTRYVFTLQP